MRTTLVSARIEDSSMPGDGAVGGGAQTDASHGFLVVEHERRQRGAGGN